VADFIEYESADRTARITLNRPDADNRFNQLMMRELADAFDAATRADVGLVVLSARGGDFSTGRDRDEVLPEGMTKAENTALIVTVSHAMRDCPAIIVAAVRGRALGFGCGLAVQSDFALAAESASFGFNEIHHGSAPRFVMAYLETYVGPKRAIDLLTTGRVFPAADAERYGLVTNVVPDPDLDSALHALVSELASRSPRALRACKSYLREVKDVPVADRFDYALSAQLRAAK
jgi:enoyl-CoA hydratase/carnithine racemase